MVERKKLATVFYVFSIAACFLGGCNGKQKNVVRTESTFSSADLKIIENYCGVVIPAKTHGVNLFIDNESCVDPSLVAELSMSINDFALLRDQMAQFPTDNVELVNGPSTRVSWWHSTTTSPVAIYHYTTPKMAYISCTAFSASETGLTVFIECVQN